jgi:transposase-like protein
VVPDTTKETLHGFIEERAEYAATVYTDDHRAYQGIPFDHKSVNHGVSEYVRNQVHVNGLESFWALLKRGYHGTYHHMSVKHLERYVNEFAGRFNDRPSDTIDQMVHMVQGMDGKQLRYRDLTAGNSL